MRKNKLTYSPIKINMPKKYRISGFTLSEVLITLGIIGMVAALVMPMVVANAEKKKNYSKLLRAFSVISQAATSIRDDNNGDFSGAASVNSDFGNLFKDKLQTSVFCDVGGTPANCYNVGSVKTLDGGAYASSAGLTGSAYPKIATNDGFVYIFRLDFSQCNGSNYKRNNVNEYCGGIWVDINGNNSPNILGKDVFTMSINKYNVTPYNNSGTAAECNIGTSGDTYNGNECAAKAIYDSAIDYY